MPPIYEYRCASCAKVFEVVKCVAEIDEAEHCPGCSMVVERRLPPRGINGGLKKSHSQETASLQRSLNERFVRSGEIDDIRHKHGKAFDDSLVGAAVDRIKKGEA